MKNKKSILLILLCSVCLFFNISIINAEEDSIPDGINENDEITITTDEMDALALEELDVNQANQLKKADGSIGPTPRYFSKSKKLAISGYLQENNYYCGPASVQNLMQAQTGKVYSQSSLASAMGTSLSGGTGAINLKNLIASRISSRYKLTNVNDKAVYGSTVESINAGYRVIYNVRTGKHLNPGYTFESGHYIVGRGYAEKSTGETYIDYFDVWYGAGGRGSYQVPSYVITNSIKKNAQSPYYIW